MLKRIFSFLMALLTVFTMLPVNAFAVTTDGSGTEVYQIGDSVWVKGEDGAPEGSSEEGTFWLPDYDENDQPITKQGLCEQTEHTHQFVCAEDCQLNHAHADSCYTTVYTGCVLHTHDENCVTETVYDCGKEVHENHDSCGSSQVCTLEAHDHASAGCAAEVVFTCAIEVHPSHEGCETQVSYSCTEDHEHDMAACGGVVNYLCGKDLHSHSADAGCACETVYACGKNVHSHDDGACVLTTVYDCGKELHTHADCTTSVRYVNCAEHTAHNDDCATGQKLTCGKNAHVCVTEGCAPDCAIPEHTHGAECDMESVYYRWTVVEDTSDTFDAEIGLPIRFFIAAPGQAPLPSGDYANYKSGLWGTTGGSTGAYAKAGTENFSSEHGTIMTEDGIRNVDNEALITEHIFKYPNGYTAETFKNFGSINIAGKTYSEEDYEIKWVTICYRKNGSSTSKYPYQRCACWGYSDPHIHIDGVLTKRVTPAEMKLTKKLLNADGSEYITDTQESFSFKLTRLQQDSSGNAINAVDTSFGTNGSIELTTTIPVGSSNASIVSASGVEIGYGYYCLEENNDANARWQNAGTDVEYNSKTQSYPTGPVYIRIATDGTLRYNSTLTGTYSQADDIIIKNTRKPYQVTYTWEGIPEGLAILPEGRNDLAPGEEVNINTSYPKGAHVLGENGKYYVFQGWQYYDADGNERQFIEYGDNNLPSSPSTIKVESNVNIHGLWVEYTMPKAVGHITISKTFINKPDGANLENFYIAVLHGGTETDIVPSKVGQWDTSGTVWTYNFPISEDGEYTIVEGKYDVAGYNVTATASVTPVNGISTDEDPYTSENIFITDGHSYYEVGRKINITLPFDTSAVSGAAAQADAEGVHAANVSFTNSYEKRTAETEHWLPAFHVRKLDGDFNQLLEGAVFTLTKNKVNPQDSDQVYTLTTDAAGDASIADLPAGIYTLVETAVPDGYIKDSTVYTVTVAADGEPTEELRLVARVVRIIPSSTPTPVIPMFPFRNIL